MTGIRCSQEPEQAPETANSSKDQARPVEPQMGVDKADPIRHAPASLTGHKSARDKCMQEDKGTQTASSQGGAKTCTRVAVPCPEREEVSVRKKSSAQKDENHFLRQKQIREYACKVLKEARAMRCKLRQGVLPDELREESPKKRKRVGFVDGGGDL